MPLRLRSQWPNFDSFIIKRVPQLLHASPSAPGAPELQRELLRVVQTHLLPTTATIRLALGKLPLAPEVMARPFPMKLLPEKRSSQTFLLLHQWEKERLIAHRFPHLIFVFEGEAEFRIAATRAHAKRNADITDETACHVLSLSAPSLLCVPPGVPHDKALPHWWGENPERAAARCFRLHILPGGAFCHTCTTRGQSHDSHSPLFLPHGQMLNIVEMILGELSARQPGWRDVVGAQLLLLLPWIERGLQTSEPLLDALLPEGLALAQAPLSARLAALERARAHIESNLARPLSPTDIARHAYISVTYLHRIFRDEMDMTLMQYVAHRRVEHAQLLLKNTRLPVAEVARVCGYSDASNFSKVFRRTTGSTPVQFRS